MKNGAHGVTITRIYFCGALAGRAAMDRGRANEFAIYRNLDVINGEMVGLGR
jgi:hypothetical protein